MTTDPDIKDEQDAAQQVITIIGAAPKAIKNEEEYKTGMSWLAGIVTKRKRIEAFFESIKKPIRLSLKTVNDKEDNILEPLYKEESALKQLTGAFYMKKRAEAQKKQDEENERNRKKREEAEAAGKSAESVAPPKVIQTLSTTVKQDGGPTATMRLIKNWRVVQAPIYCQSLNATIYRSDNRALAEIPDTCWVLDTAKANAVAKSGLCPALELYDVPSQAISG